MYKLMSRNCFYFFAALLILCTGFIRLTAAAEQGWKFTRVQGAEAAEVGTCILDAGNFFFAFHQFTPTPLDKPFVQFGLKKSGEADAKQFTFSFPAKSQVFSTKPIIGGYFEGTQAMPYDEDLFLAIAHSNTLIIEKDSNPFAQIPLDNSNSPAKKFMTCVRNATAARNAQKSFWIGEWQTRAGKCQLTDESLIFKDETLQGYDFKCKFRSVEQIKGFENVTKFDLSCVREGTNDDYKMLVTRSSDDEIIVHNDDGQTRILKRCSPSKKFFELFDHNFENAKNKYQDPNGCGWLIQQGFDVRFVPTKRLGSIYLDCKIKEWPLNTPTAKVACDNGQQHDLTLAKDFVIFAGKTLIKVSDLDPTQSHGPQCE